MRENKGVSLICIRFGPCEVRRLTRGETASLFIFWLFVRQHSTIFGNISRIRKYLSSQTAEVLVHAFVSSRLDYCNSLLYGLPKESLKKLQHVQNVAARIVTHTRKCDHITPVLCQLHWLPIEERIVFKILLLTFKCLNDLAPPYLCDLITKYVPRRNLRSVNGHRLVDIGYKLTRYGSRSFSVASAKLCHWISAQPTICCNLSAILNTKRTRSVSSESFYVKFSRSDKMYAFFSRIGGLKMVMLKSLVLLSYLIL